MSIANVALRGITMAGRFVLLVALAAYLSPAEVGVFALFTAASLWGVYLQGMELYLFSLRELVAAQPGERARRTRDAFALYACAFVAACIVWTAFFAAGFLPWQLFGWFLVLLALEQALQELYRLLNAFGRPLWGSLVLFARSGGWMYVVAILLWRDPSSRDLDVVFRAWTIGGGIGLVLAAVGLRNLPWRRLPPVDWAWLRRGLAIGLPLLGGSLAWRGITVFERWYVGFSEGESTLGVFGFYAAIAAAIPVLAESGVGAVLYPRMMKAWQLGDLDTYRACVRRLWVTFGVFVAIACPLALAAVSIAVDQLRTAAYAEGLGVFHVLVVSAAVTSLAAVPQYMLWARNRDRSMIVIAIAGFGTTVLLDLVLVPCAGAMGAAWGQLAGVLLVLALRLVALRVADPPG